MSYITKQKEDEIIADCNQWIKKDQDLLLDLGVIKQIVDVEQKSKVVFDIIRFYFERNIGILKENIQLHRDLKFNLWKKRRLLRESWKESKRFQRELAKIENVSQIEFFQKEDSQYRKCKCQIEFPVEYISKCCGGKFCIISSGEGTSYYECLSCGNSCDLIDRAR